MNTIKLKDVLLLLMLTFGTLSVSAQNSVNGTVTDTINHIPLKNVAVSVLTQADSFLYSFTRTNQDGTFKINVPASGDYFLLMEYPHYANYTSEVLKPNSNISLGNIIMLTKAHLLEEVLVKKKVGAITLKGDTTEFAADSFKVQPNATVEELLKRLPGLEVDKNGKITAQGQTVKRVLVDGEEFFGDDPKLVTKNLRADIVDKVQVYDKKSDQAAFTGISDGNDEKTINLKIKESAKHGTFGKVEVGGGTHGFHQSEGNFNQFNKNQKFSVTGAVGNTSKVGLDWDNQSMNWNNQDNTNNDGADIQTSQGSNSDLISWDGNYGQKGIPLSQFGGIHYDNTYKYGTKLLGDYKINNLGINGNEITDVQKNLDSGSLITHSNNIFSNKSFRNKLDGKGEIYFDSAKNSSMIVNVHGQLDHRNSMSNMLGYTMNELGDTINTNRRFLNSKGDINTFSANALYRHKFKKERRTLSVFLSEQYNTNNNDGFLDNETYYFKTTGIIDSLTQQRKDNNNNTLVLNAKATYSEPLSKNASLIINYGIITSNSNSDNLSYNQSGPNQYNSPDSAYSNSYKFNQLMHRTGLFYYYNTKKTNFNIGTNVGFNQFTQTNKFTHEDYKRNFVNWYPQSFFRYSFNSNKKISIRYDGSNTQPSMTQIQPLAQNTDPLNVYLGNQDLKPSFSNNLNIDFQTFDIIKFSGVFVGLSGTNTLNAITTNTNTDVSIGKTTYEYTNANGNYTLNSYAGIYRKIKKWDITSSIFAGYSQSKSINYVNRVENASNTKQASLRYGFRKDKEKAYFLALEGNFGYNWNSTSLQSQQNNNYFSYNLNPNGNVYLTESVKLNVDYNFNYYGKSQSFNKAYTIGLFNASISKTFLKNEGLEIRAGVNDLFNKNINLKRTNYGNQIYQVLNSTIKRYFMLTAIWNFKTGMGAGASNK